MQIKLLQRWLSQFCSITLKQGKDPITERKLLIPREKLVSLRQSKHMELYVFPLGNVLLYPSSAKPLHIYEPRYIKMVEDAVANKVNIALGFVDDPQRDYKYRPGEELSFVRSVVGFGKPLIVDRKPDGSMIVFLQGQGKAKLGRVVDRDCPYIICEATEIPENNQLSVNVFQQFLLLQKVLVSWMQNHIPDPQVRTQFMSQIRTPNEVIGCYASYMLADHDLQQLVLETNDINEKVSMIKIMVASGELL